MSAARTNRQVYAVCRHDDNLDGLDGFTVVKVFALRTEAEEEEIRLNAVNREKGSRYFLRITRMVDA
jgi:hypothetical protein